MNLMFSYGTSKRGEPNHEQLQERQGKFISEATTVEKWPQIYSCPSYPTEQKNFGKVKSHFKSYSICKTFKIKFIFKHVSGELYSVDDQTLEFLDWFVGVSDTFFKIDVREKATG